MCGYDPFKYADNYESEEELLKELEMEKDIINIDIDAITEKIDELKKAEAYHKFELKNVEKELEKEELKLIALLDQTGVDEIMHGIYRFGWKYTTRTAFDQKLFSLDYPELLEKYKRTKEKKEFEFKINA